MSDVFTSADTLVQDTLETLQAVHVRGVGRCFGATRFVQAVTGQDSKHSRGMLHNARRSVGTGRLAQKVLCRKAVIPGEHVPIYVVTAKEAESLLVLIPLKHRHTKTAISSTKKPSRSGFVYAAYSRGNGLKVGMTCQRNPWLRVRSLNTATLNPYKLIDFVQCDNPRELERLLLSVLQPWRAGKHNLELFRLSARAGRMLFDAYRAANKQKTFLRAELLRVVTPARLRM